MIEGILILMGLICVAAFTAVMVMVAIMAYKEVFN
jgi:hypothetical protein